MMQERRPCRSIGYCGRPGCRRCAELDRWLTVGVRWRWTKTRRPEPRSLIPSTWVALEEHLKLWGAPLVPVGFQFPEYRDRQMLKERWVTK
jgi:hypothetical protein